MQITITITDADWQQFQAVAQEAVEQSWDGNYEDFASYIMAVNLETYIKAQQKKQEKKLKRALADYEASMAKETVVVAEKSEKPVPSPKKPETAQSTKKAPSHPEQPEQAMTSTEVSERIAQLEQVAVKRRTLAEAQELQELLILRKKQTRKTEAEL